MRDLRQSHKFLADEFLAKRKHSLPTTTEVHLQNASSALCVYVCVCVCVTVPGSQLSNVFLSVSSRCALSYQACQTLTFRRCLLLDSIARLPEPEGKRHFPSPSTSISQSRSRSAVSSCHLQPQPLPLGSMLDMLDD